MTREEKLTGKYEQLSMFEKDAYLEGYQIVAGIDEAGRGPLAGPVVAAACILREDKPILGLDDSKKLSPAKRDNLYDEILEKALCFSVIRIEHDVIDESNILEATKRAMRLCVQALSVTPDLLLIDAVDLKGTGIPVRPIIKGDAKSNSIAAASILAKVTRDRIMVEYDSVYPGYGFAKHKGYGTREHYEAIEALSLCPIHRRTFLKGHF
jgi:ribonuclease HII